MHPLFEVLARPQRADFYSFYGEVFLIDTVFRDQYQARMEGAERERERERELQSLSAGYL